MDLKISDAKDYIDVGVELGLTEVEYGYTFIQSLEEGNITPEWIEENAIWLQYDDESDDDYQLFRNYVSKAIDDWSFAPHTEIAKKNYWKNRRLAYLKYKEWLQRRKEEIAQLDAINQFRINEVEILSQTSKSVLTLVEKLQKKIETVDIEEIATRDIPSFINSLAKFSEMASDARARALAVDKLLQLHEEEMDAALLRQTVAELSANGGFDIESIQDE